MRRLWPTGPVTQVKMSSILLTYFLRVGIIFYCMWRNTKKIAFIHRYWHIQDRCQTKQVSGGHRKCAKKGNETWGKIDINIFVKKFCQVYCAVDSYPVIISMLTLKGTYWYSSSDFSQIFFFCTFPIPKYY
jgi:hypothetical protein